MGGKRVGDARELPSQHSDRGRGRGEVSVQVPHPSQWRQRGECHGFEANRGGLDAFLARDQLLETAFPDGSVPTPLFTDHPFLGSEVVREIGHRAADASDHVVPQRVVRLQEREDLEGDPLALQLQDLVQNERL